MISIARSGFFSDLGAPEIGLIGASLGGYNTALFISLTDIASFGAMMVPAVNFSRPLGPDTARLPFAVDDRFREKIRRVWELHSPLNFRPRLPVEKILVVASRGDLVCPFDYARELCDRWGIREQAFPYRRALAHLQPGRAGTRVVRVSA